MRASARSVSESVFRCCCWCHWRRTLAVSVSCVFISIFIFILLLLALPESGWHWMNGKWRVYEFVWCVCCCARDSFFNTRKRDRERMNKCGTVVPRYIDIVWNNMNVFSVFIRIHVLKSLRAIIITTPRSVDDSLRSFCWRLFVASSVCRLRSSLVSLLSHRLCCATVWIVWVLRKYAYDV